MLRPPMLVALVVSVLIVLAVTACAQPPEPPGPAAAGQEQGQRGFRGARGDQGQDAMARLEAFRMLQAQQPAPAMVVADGFVYVIFGGTLFQFQVDGLKLVAQAQLMQLLPRQTPPGAPMQPAPAGTAPIAPMPGMPGPRQ